VIDSSVDASVEEFENGVNVNLKTDHKITPVQYCVLARTAIEASLNKTNNKQTNKQKNNKTAKVFFI